MSEALLKALVAGELQGTKELRLSCGLKEFPRQIFDLEDSLEVLDLSGNQLSELPDDLHRLQRLKILFCSQNNFQHLPGSVGQCPRLEMVGFKSNHVRNIAPEFFPKKLRWLILTDNQIEQLPPTVGSCSRLKKLMLSGNRLSALPEELSACRDLELIRLAANRLDHLPDWLLRLPRLSWLAFAGNPCSDRAMPLMADCQEITWSSLKLGERLGEGASGVIYRAELGDVRKAVAVKVFKGAMTSDGLPASEMAANLAAGQHDNMVEVLGRITAHPTGAEGLVLSLIPLEYRNLGGPPSLETCTRDVYAADAAFSLGQIVSLSESMASVLVRLHSRGITHGDFYAHNILWQDSGHSFLGDFGAASFYARDDVALTTSLGSIEVRAFGCLLEELLSRGTEKVCHAADRLAALRDRCLLDETGARPGFESILQELMAIGRLATA